MIGKPLILTKENRAASIAGTKTMTRRVITLPKYVWDDVDGKDSDIEAVWTLGKKPLSYDDNEFAFLDMAWPIETYPTYIKARYSVGEIVWMKEPYQIDRGHLGQRYGAELYGVYLDDNAPIDKIITDEEWIKWNKWQSPRGKKSSLFLFKSLGRHFFKVTGIKPPHRIQDISEADAEAEGINWMRNIPDVDETLTAKQLFMCLWNSINEKPKPVIDINKVVVKYVSYPWDDTGKWAKLTTFRGKPHECHPNPWVWPYEYRKVKI